MTYHTFAKPVSFFSAGTLAQLHHSSDIDRIGPGSLVRAPVASVLFIVAALMITGSPPFGLFFSEMLILQAGFAGSHPVVISVFLLCLVLLFCGFLYQVGRLVLGVPRESSEWPTPEPERLDLCMGTTLVAAVLAVVSAFYLPGGLLRLVQSATRVVEMGR